MATTEQFVKDYIEAWSVQNDASRKELIAKVYAEEAAFYSEGPGDGSVECRGLREIAENIAQVNVRLVQDKRLITESTGYTLNHDALRVQWRMLTPDGTVAMTGMNLLLRNDEGKIMRDYIFIGS